MARIFFRPGTAGAIPAAWLIQPKGTSTASPVLAIHGLNREAEQMANLLVLQADATGRTIVLPLFDRASWPGFQRAACKQRSDWALLSLLQVLRDERWIGDALPDISGFSGGAQFAHRFTWLYPDRVGRLCAVSPGWWTFPDARGSYPLGISTDGPGRASSAFRLRANLARFLDREIHVSVGALDVVQDENMRQDPEVMAQQGPNRVVRARNWTAAAIRTARQLGVRPRISFKLMENCAHSFGDCVANGHLASSFVSVAPKHPKTPALPDHHQLEEVA